MHHFTNTCVQNFAQIIFLKDQATKESNRSTHRCVTDAEIDQFFRVVQHDDACLRFEIGIRLNITFVDRSGSTLALLPILFFLFSKFLLVFCTLTLLTFFIGFLNHCVCIAANRLDQC